MTSIEKEIVSDYQCIKNTNISGDNLDTPEDEWSEDEAEIPAGVTDSMLTPPDFVDDSERQEIYNLPLEKVIDLLVSIEISTQKKWLTPGYSWVRKDQMTKID
jgi:hypothetical protein